MKKILVAFAAILALGLSGCGMFSDSPATVASKYQCTQTVNGQTTPAHCVQDSNGNNFYLNYWIWRQVIIGHPVTSYEPQRFWDNTNHEASDAHVPATEHQYAHGGDEFGVHGGGDEGGHVSVGHGGE